MQGAFSKKLHAPYLVRQIHFIDSKEAYMELLTTESRGGIIENRHYGIICVVDENGIVSHVGNPDTVVYFRSSSKPIQALPLLLMGLDKKYGLSDIECAIMAGSNAGEPECTAVVESLMEKAGIREEDFVLGAHYPDHPGSRDAAVCAGLPPRKVWHGCAPKHVATMLMQRELTGSIKNYHLPESAAQRLIRHTMALFSETPYNKIAIGIDGCGVPVFGVPAYKMAKAYFHLACPETLGEPCFAAAAVRMIDLMHQYPIGIRGNDYLCTMLNTFPNVVAKGGASGVYAFGLKKERLGMMLKIMDGTETSWQIVIREILRQVSPEINAGLIETLENTDFIGMIRKNITNAAGETVGTMEPMFVLR